MFNIIFIPSQSAAAYKHLGFFIVQARITAMYSSQAARCILFCHIYNPTNLQYVKYSYCYVALGGKAGND